MQYLISFFKLEFDLFEMFFSIFFVYFLQFLVIYEIYRNCQEESKKNYGQDIKYDFNFFIKLKGQICCFLYYSF